MTYGEAFIDLVRNGPLWAQLAYLTLGLFCLSGPVLLIVGFIIEIRAPSRYRRQLLARRRR